MKNETSPCHIDAMEVAPPQSKAATDLLQIEPAPSESTASEDLCQIDSAPLAGRMRRPGSLYGPMRFFWNLRHNGIRHTLRAALKSPATAIGSTIGLVEAPRATPSRPDTVLDLQPGELIEVKSYREILETLDGKGRSYGLVFTPEMRKHCGRQYRVFKRLELMFDEYRHTQKRLKNTVLLEHVYCTGEGIGCDRACFLYWREVWLRRVGDNLNKN